MKVLIVITKGDIGGAQVSVLNLAKEGIRNGVDMEVGFGEGDFLKNELEKNKIPYHQFKRLKRSRNFFSNVFFIFELKNFLDKNKFDAVHFNSSNALFGSMGAKMAKTKPKTVFTFRGLSMLDENYQAPFFSRWFYFFLFKFLLLFVDESVFVSRSNFEIALRKKLAKRGTVIYNGLEELNFLGSEEAIKYLERETKLNLGGKFIIGSVGRLSYQKNYEFFIKTFPEILKIKENAIGIIFGDGPNGASCEKLIKDMNLGNKIFLIRNDHAHSYIKVFDMFVLTSRYEGLPIVLLEALSAGLPVLASDVGGNRELLSEEQLYALENEKDFFEKFKKLTDSGNLQKAREMNLEKSNSFSIKNTFLGYRNLYKN